MHSLASSYTVIPVQTPSRSSTNIYTPLQLIYGPSLSDTQCGELPSLQRARLSLPNYHFPFLIIFLSASFIIIA